MNKNTNIHIIGGTGRMGNWLKNFLESQGFGRISVSGKEGASLKVLKSARIVFISVPISKAPEVIRHSGKIVSKDCLLIDLSSVMEESAKALKETGKPSLVLHFLFGPTVTSIQNQNIIICHPREGRDLDSTFQGNDKVIGELIKLLKEAGANVSEMTPREHDEKMALVQNLTHFINISLAKTFIKEDIDLSGKIATPVLLAQLSSLTRVVTQDPNLLLEIQLNNSRGVPVVEKFLEEQNKLLQLVKEKNSKKLLEDIENIHSKFESSQAKSPSKKLTNFSFTPLGCSLKGSVAYLGPKGTFSHQAAQMLSKDGPLFPCGDFYEIFESVKTQKADFGVVPAENSSEGTIRETLDYLVEFDFQTNGSIYLPVHHCLLSKEEDIKDITKVISHPQGLAQCRSFLREKLPLAKIEATTSTVAAVKNLSKGAALIGPEIAGKLYGLNVVLKNIEDNEENITRFYIISKKGVKAFPSGKTLLFLTVFNRVGILKDILEIFAHLSINLSKIESRPSKEKIWDYCFFIELEIPLDDQKLTLALNMLKQFCPEIKVLGGV